MYYHTSTNIVLYTRLGKFDLTFFILNQLNKLQFIDGSSPRSWICVKKTVIRVTEEGV